MTRMMNALDLDEAYTLLQGPNRSVSVSRIPQTHDLWEPLLQPDVDPGCSMWHSLRCFFDAPRQMIVNKLK